MDRGPIRFALTCLVSAALLASGLLAASAAAVPPSTAASAHVQRIAPRGDVGPDGDAIRWRRCSAPADRGMQCARFAVPWDWRKPLGRKYSLALKRLPVLAPRSSSSNKPTLFVNPGGPGGSGTELLEAFRNETALRRNYYIVGWDPRGVPTTRPQLAKCPNQQLQLPVTGAFNWGEVSDGFAAEANNSVCVNRNAAQLRSVGTNNVVRDLDALRAAVGDKRLSYLGYSYGTTIGRLYAMRYPNRIAAMLLDGVVMPGNSMSEYSTSAIRASNAAWDYLIDLVDTDILELGDDVSDLLQTATIELGPTQIDRWTFWRRSLGAAATSDPVAAYTDWVCSLAAAAGLPTTACPPSSLSIRSGLRALAKVRASSEDEDDPIVAAVRCTDYRLRPNSGAVASGFVQAGGVPETATNIFNRSLMCTGWPTPNLVPALARPLRTSQRVLFVNGTADQATGYWGARRTASHFVGHRFITVNTGMHALFRSKASACIRGPVLRYLVSGRLPASDLYCQRAEK